MKKVLVPTDGSELAEHAAAYAIEMARSCGGSLIFLNVLDEVSPGYAFEIESGVSLDMTEIDRQRRLYAQESVDRLKQKAETAGVEAEAKVSEGHPWQEIVTEAEKEGADHIVMGSHGHRALAAAVMGNVTFNVIHGARVPVTVVPAAPE